MKKTLSVLLVICLMFTSIFSFPAYAAGDDVNVNINDLTTKTLAMTDISGKYKTQGRTVLNSDGVLLAHYPATGIEFDAYCKGDVSVTFGTYQPLQWKTNDCYFTVIVDGEVMPRETCHITGTTSGDVTVTIANDLAEGNHTFKIYRQNEIKYAYLGFKSITLDGYLLDAPEDKEMYIEFVGASQWGGAGNLGDANSPNFDTPEVQDATQGLTYLTPQLLDADWSVVSLAGTGAYWGIEGYPMNRMYNYYGYMNDKSTLYDFNNARTPDYVVIGLGTNDVSKAEKFGKTEADIYEAFNYFIRLLRMKNPGAKIVWVHGMLNDQATPYVKKAVEDLGGAEYGVYEFHVEKNNDGANLHPSVEGHTRMAGEIAEFIRSIDSQEFTSEFNQKPYAPLSEGKVIMESDFNDADGTNWQKLQGTYVKYMDDDNDGVNDFVRITGNDKVNTASLSAPFKVVPGKDYELSFWARIPEESNDFFTDTYKYYPKFALYKATVSDGKVTDYYKESTNDYVYDQDGFTNSVWTFGSELYEFVVKKYTTLNTNNQYQAYGCMDTDKIYDGWTRVTYKFTGFSADGSTTAENVAVSFALPKASVNSAGCLFDIKDVKMIEIGTNTGSEDTLTTTIMTSDFEKDVTATSWFTSGDVQSKNDSTGDFVRLTVVDMKSAYVRSKAFALTPGKKYTLTYSMRIPEGSENYSTAWTQPFSPEAIFYQINNGKVGDSVTSKLSDSNLYAHQSFSRRVDMPFIWNVEGYDTHERKGYSDTGYNKSSALYVCTGGSDTSVLNNVFSTWKKVTLEFTATAETEGSTDPTIAVLQFRVQNPKNGLIYDVKDVTLTETSLQPETPEEPETPEYKEPVAPEGAVYYESFETASDDSVTAFVQNASTVNVSDTVYASGYKALAISADNKYIFIPIDTTNFTPGTTYEFSMDWKLPATSQINQLMFVGYNGETLDSKFAKSSNVYTYKANSNYTDKTISGTGKWQNVTLCFGNSNYTDHKQYGILLRYSSGTLYLDNLAVAPAKEETVKKITLTEEARTDDTVKVLAFGNSFSNDSVAWLSHIAKADGKDLRVANCVIGGCSLQRHYSNIFNGSSDKYNFTYYTKAHGVKTYSKASMQEALMATDWDYITLQQASGESYKANTYEPYLTELITYIKTFHPNVKILFNETWAYPDESHMFIGQSAFDTDGDGNSEEAPMFERVREAYLKASQNHGFTPLIPVGEAILRARDEMDRNLSRDGHHLDDRGRLIAALMWYEMFTGVSALDNKVDLTDNSTFKVSYSTVEITGASDINGYNGVEYKGTGLNITAEEQQIMKTIAHETIELYKKANETQLAIEAIGEVTENSGDAIAKAEALRNELGNDTLLPNLQTLLDARAAFDALTPDVVIGDFSGDGKVDTYDVTALARHFAGWDSDLNEDILDLNGDGVQNLKDLILLARFVAGWDVSIA